MKLSAAATLAGLSLVCFCTCDFHRIGDASPVSDDVDQLARMIRLDQARPARAQWQTAHLPGGERLLFALLEFDVERLRALIETSTAEPRPVLSFTDGPPEWFPEELRQRLILESDGGYVFDGPAWDARTFARPPLVDGFMARLGESDQLFICLAAR